jgi:hypothetical protein
MSTTHARESRGTPEQCKNDHFVQEWCTFMMKMNTHARTGAPQQTVAFPKWPFGVRGAHMYDENKHRARTGAPRHTAAFPKWPSGAGVAHMYDESEHHERTGVPPQSALELINPHLGLSTPPEPLKLQLSGELVTTTTDTSTTTRNNMRGEGAQKTTTPTWRRVSSWCKASSKAWDSCTEGKARVWGVLVVLPFEGDALLENTVIATISTYQQQIEQRVRSDHM